jgi:hypothetical protein
MNEEELPIEQNIVVEEKDFPASPKSEDIKLDETNYPSVTDEMGNVITGDQSFNKIEIPEEPAFPTKPEQPFEEKVKVEGVEDNLPQVVDPMGNVAIGELDPVKAAREILADEEESLNRKQSIIDIQKKIIISGNEGMPISLYDFINSKDLNDVGTTQSIVAGITSGTLKMPREVLTVIGKTLDLFGPPPKEKEGAFNNIMNWYNNTLIGEITNIASETADKTAIGRLTEAFTEIYGAVRLGTGAVTTGAKIAGMAEELYAAGKAGRLITSTEMMAKATEKVNLLNNLTGWKKWTAIGIGGGGIGQFFLVPNEEIKTLGDWLGGPTAQDYDKKPLPKDDAVRFFNNKLKFAAENSVFAIGIAGAYSFGKSVLSAQGKEMAFSTSRVERWMDKFASYLRPEGNKKAVPQLYQESERALGKIEAAETTTKDLINDIDRNIVNIRKGNEALANNTKLEEFLAKTNLMIHSGDNVVQKGKIIFKGFNNKQLNEYEKFAKDLGVKEEQIAELKTNFFKIRNSYNDFMNEVLQGKNLNVAPKEFNKLMMDRTRNVLATEYRMFTEKSLIPMYSYKPAASSVEEVKEIIQRNALRNGVKTYSGDSDVLVNTILNSAKINAETKAPSFRFVRTDPLNTSNKQIVTYDLSKNFESGKFVPTELIKTRKEFQAFQKYFGARQDPRSAILNVMGDLSEFAAKDRFANNIRNISEGLVKSKQRSIVYNSPLEAERNFNPKGTPKEWVKEIVQLNMGSRIGNVYTNPLNGKFTTKEWADALKFQEKLPFEFLNDIPLYKWTTIMPKAVVSSGKTVFSIFTQIRNPIQNIPYLIGTGNAFKDPRFLYRNFKQAINSIQPQLFGRRNLPKDQAWYKFLQEERVVGQSADFNEQKKLWEGLELRGDRILDKLFGGVGRGVTKFSNIMKSTYLGSDDFFKSFNVMAEYDSLKTAYRKAAERAAKNGTVFKMPDELSILREATSIVKNITQNYGSVGPGIKGLRYTPIGNFPSWTSEIFRNTVNIMEQGLKEIKDPVKFWIGARRLTGFGVATGVILPYYIDKTRGAYDYTKDQVSAMRKFLFDYEKDATIAPFRDKDGNMQYQNLSTYPFTTITDIVQPVIAGVDNVIYNNLQDPLIKTMMIGLGNSFVRASRPFLEESIWTSYISTVFGKDGLLPNGARLWNPEAPLSEKWDKAIEYGIKQNGIGSYEQGKRILKAFFNQPGERGEKYNLDDELLGIVGGRIQNLDVPERLQSKLSQYVKRLDNDRQLLTTSDVLKGGLTSKDEIVKRFILSLDKKFETDKDMRQTFNAAQTLEVPDNVISKKFKEAGLSKQYSQLKNNKFEPFDISPKIKGKFGEQFKKIEERDFNIEYDKPFDSDTLSTINAIKRAVRGVPLEGNFRDYIDLKDWISGEAPQSGQPSRVANLPIQPQPNAKILQSAQSSQTIMPQTGLTNTEMALLSDEEKAMRLSQRGTPPQQLS